MAAESLLVLETNLDDIPAEQVGFAMETLLAAGALDVWTTPIGMKKCRPGVMISILTKPHLREKLEAILFQHTTTLGVRCYEVERRSLPRISRVVATKYGEIRVKESTLPDGTKRTKPEADDIYGIAQKHGVSAATVLEEVRLAETRRA